MIMKLFLQLDNSNIKSDIDNQHYTHFIDRNDFIFNIYTMFNSISATIYFAFNSIIIFRDQTI